MRQAQMFGGEWTEEKLGILREYLDAYTQALKNQPFRLLYMDAFAGSGYRAAGADSAMPLFPELEDEAAQGFLDGSPRIALQIARPFDQYVFIEKSPEQADALRGLREEFSEFAERIKVISGDCNVEIPRICRTVDWRSVRSVLFLDPFGMQLEWNTMEAVAGTGTIDLWVLFPVSAVNRLLPNDGDIPAGWEKRLDSVFGTNSWRGEFYSEGGDAGLLPDEPDRLQKVCSMEGILDYYLSRLQTIFPRVADNPRWLYNRSGTPLFVLCFAMANSGRRAQDVAMRIADYILRS